MIWILNGFWGENSDWDFCRDPLLRKLGLKINFLSSESLPENDPEPILLAYSMGARIGLSKFLLKDNPFKVAILIAPSLGLSQKKAWERFDEDERLAQRFLSSESFESLNQFWNSKELFGQFKINRIEALGIRKKLAHELRDHGLGRQDNLLPQIHKIKIPTLYVVGEKDRDFRIQMERAKEQSPYIRGLVLKGAFHRAHLENKSDFLDGICEFLFDYFKGKRECL